VFCEFVGTLVLYGSFSQIPTIPQPLFYAFFHSISAFCNAGIPRMVLELGYTQHGQLAEMLARYGFKNIQVMQRVKEVKKKVVKVSDFVEVVHGSASC